jgi:hypothetical protein
MVVVLVTVPPAVLLMEELLKLLLVPAINLPAEDLASANPTDGKRSRDTTTRREHGVGGGGGGDVQRVHAPYRRNCSRSSSVQQGRADTKTLAWGAW